MGLNIIVREKRSDREKVIQERGKVMLRHFYQRECENKEGDFTKITKRDVTRAWSDDARGDIDPAIMPP